MKKLIALLLTLAMVLALAACATSTKPTEKPTDAHKSGDETKAPDDSQASDVKVGDAGKIAVIRNMTASDHTTQFFAGITDEGHALGYEVDTYVSEGDDAKMQDLMDQCLSKDYKIWIVSHANEGYQFDYVTKAVDKGIKVVCFDCQGEYVDGVTYVDQSDLVMAQECVEQMMDKLKSVGGSEPYTIAEYITLGMIIPFDLRGEKFQEYADAGKIDLTIMAWDKNDTYSSAYTQATAIMTKTTNPVGFFAAANNGTIVGGLIDAIKDCGREADCFVNGVDISNEVIELLQKYPNFIGAACCDPYVVGVVCTRLALMKELGEETPQIYHCVPTLVTGENLESSDTMQNLGNKIKGFTTTDEFKTEGVEARRAQYANAQ